MPRLPGPASALGAVVGVLQAQTEALVALPETVRALNRSVQALADVVTSSRETAAALQRLAVRADSIVEELEGPLRALAPGLQRVATVLDDPVVEELPDALRQVRADLLPVLRTLADTHERIAFVAGSTERLMSFVDDTSRTLAAIPGAALLGRRRPAPSATGTAIPMPPGPPPAGPA